jgi:hypothetical protein
MDHLLNLVSKQFTEILENIYMAFEAKVSDQHSRDELKTIIDGLLSTSYLEAKVPVKDNVCGHLMSSGKRRGEPCGKPNVSGQLFCKRHLPNKCTECHRPIAQFSISGTVCRVHLFQELGNERAVYIHKDKHDRWINKPTGLVFRNEVISDVERPVVYGRDGGDGSVVVDLLPDDYECIKVYGFQVTQHLVPHMRAYVTGQPVATVEVPIVLVD